MDVLNNLLGDLFIMSIVSTPVICDPTIPIVRYVENTALDLFGWLCSFQERERPFISQILLHNSKSGVIIDN
jgi:hypothetical protein